MKNAAQSAVDAEIIYPLSNDIVFGLVMQDPETDTIACLLYTSLFMILHFMVFG